MSKKREFSDPFIQQYFDSLSDREREEFEARLAWALSEAEEILAKRPQGEALERLRRPVAEITVPDHWHGYAFFEPAFFVRDAQGAVATDSQGGGPVHEGAECPLCHRPLQLIWTVCLDERFPDFVRESFSGLDELSLYYCARCPKPTIYRLLSPDRLATIRPDVPVDYDPLHDKDEESPFDDVPDAFQRKGICLVPIPAALERLKHKIEKDKFGSLSPSERALLSQIFAQEVDSEYELFASQLGGLPWFLQTHREIVCPNKECVAHMEWYPRTEHETRFLMKELAVVCNDVGLDMEMNYSQIAFHVCWLCQTIHAEYRCD